jgi:hypothetical protein
MRWIFCLSTFFLFADICAQPKTDSLLQNILSRNADTLLQRILTHPETYRIQIIYTQINRNKKNRPSFKNYYFNVDPELYFNPASTVKLPLAFLALEKLNELHVEGVNKYTAVQYDSAYAHQTTEYRDTTSESGLPAITHFIKKAFLVSDNDAYNRLYEFTGQETINKKLQEKGYNDIRITRQFMRNTPDENRHTNPVRFINEDRSLIYTQPMAYNKDSFDFSHTVKLGNAYYNRDDSLVNEPMDFTTHNNISLEDLQQLLQSVLFPSSVPKKHRFGLTEDDHNFLYQYLSQYPSETNYPKYDTAEYYDSYVKFFFRSGNHKIPDYIRVFNKVGWAYGFLTDASYIVDFKNNIEFMLAATVYVNSDGILNDDKYDYETIGWPFMYKLGQTVYNYELSRKRKYQSDLSRFKISYEHRNAADKRPAVKDVDN